LEAAIIITGLHRISI